MYKELQRPAAYFTFLPKSVLLACLHSKGEKERARDLDSRNDPWAR